MKKYDYADVTFGDGLTVYFFAVVANLVMQFALTFAVMPLQTVTNVDISGSDYFNLIAMILLQGAFISVPLIYYCCKKKAVPRLSSPLRKPKPTDAAGVILPIITLICFYLPAAYFMVLLDKMGYTSSADVNMDTPGKIILGAIATVICAPVVEEIIFRGFLLSGLREKFHPYIAVLLSGLAFSLMHMNPEQTVYQFFLGCACGLIAVKSGRLLPAIIAHATNNAIVMLLGIPKLGNAFNSMIDFFTATTLSAVLSTILLFVAGIALIYGICLGVEKLDKWLQKRRAGEDYGGLREQEEKEKINEPETAGPPKEVNPFEGYGVEPHEVKAPPAKNKSSGAVALFLGGLGICLMMWMMVLVSGLVMPSATGPEDTDLPTGEVTQTVETDINE